MTEQEGSAAGGASEDQRKSKKRGAPDDDTESNHNAKRPRGPDHSSNSSKNSSAEPEIVELPREEATSSRKPVSFSEGVRNFASGAESHYINKDLLEDLVGDYVARKAQVRTAILGGYVKDDQNATYAENVHPHINVCAARHNELVRAVSAALDNYNVTERNGIMGRGRRFEDTFGHGHEFKDQEVLPLVTALAIANTKLRRSEAECRLSPASIKCAEPKPSMQFSEPEGLPPDHFNSLGELRPEHHESAINKTLENIEGVLDRNGQRRTTLIKKLENFERAMGDLEKRFIGPVDGPAAKDLSESRSAFVFKVEDAFVRVERSEKEALSGFKDYVDRTSRGPDRNRSRQQRSRA